MTTVDNKNMETWITKFTNGQDFADRQLIIDESDVNCEAILTCLGACIGDFDYALARQIEQVVNVKFFDYELQYQIKGWLKQCGLTVKDDLVNANATKTEAMVVTLARYVSECEYENVVVPLADEIVTTIHFLCANPVLTSEDIALNLHIG